MEIFCYCSQSKRHCLFVTASLQVDGFELNVCGSGYCLSMYVTEKRFSISLVFGDVMLEVCKNCIGILLGLAVCLQSIFNGREVLDGRQCAYCGVKIICELHTLFSLEVGWEARYHDPVIVEKILDVCECCLRRRYGACKRFIAVSEKRYIPDFLRVVKDSKMSMTTISSLPSDGISCSVPLSWYIGIFRAQLLHFLAV